MRKLIVNGAIIFALLCVASFLWHDLFQTQYGEVSFFQRHGLLFLVFITFFPRLTLLLSSVPTGGLAWWLGFIFCPRLLVAMLATVTYFHTNPLLVVISWLVAISGETAEKVSIGRRPFYAKTFRFDQDRPAQKQKFEDAVEVEYRNID